MLDVFDLHCDTPHNIFKNKFNHIIPEQLHQQHYRGAVFAHFIDPKSKYPFIEVVQLLATTITYSETRTMTHIVRSYKDINKKKVNIILGVEGGHIFDRTFKQIETLYALGVRVFTITWNNSNQLGHSGLEADKRGLTKKGKEFIKNLAQYATIVDISHASTRTVLDVCSICENQIMASHSCVRALNPSFLRNIDDRAIKAIAQRGGVVGINFSRYHLGGYNVADHIDYVTDNFGIETVAIGSDFDGINDPVFSSPKDIKGLEKALLVRGYKRKDIEKIFCENFLRVFKKISHSSAKS
jgi:membrane dipeptidase